MPIARFKMPDGRIGRFEVPEGTTPEQAQAMIQESIAPFQSQQQPSEQPKTTWGGVSSEVGKGLLRGASAVASNIGQGSFAPGLGPLLGPLTAAAGNVLKTPAPKYTTATPATSVERFAGTGAEVFGGGAAMGGVTSIPNALRTVASALGGATGEQMGGETGQAIGTFAPVIAAPVRSLAHAIRNKTYPSAGAIGVRAAGDRAQKVIDALRTTKSDVPGVNLTAGQASIPANSAEFAALQRKIAQGPAASTYAGPAGISGQQEAARLAALRQNVAGTPKDLEIAMTARENISRRNYGYAYKQAIKGDPELAKLSSDPFFKREVADALELAQSKGINPKNDLTRFLHIVKEGLDAKIRTFSNPTQPAISNEAKSAIGDVKKRLVDWLGKKNPQYDVARVRHMELSKPINQMKFGQELERALIAPATEAERAGSFATAARKAETAVSKATGKPRIEDLTPKQRAVVDALELDFKRNADFSELAKAGSKNLESRIGQPELPPTGFFQPFVSAARGWVNKALGTGVEKGLEKAGVIMQNPQEMARAMAQEMKKSGIGVGIPEDALYRAALSTILYQQGK